MGTGFLLVLYAAAFVWLFMREKRKWKRAVLLYAPGLILILFALPPVRMLYTRVLNEGATYYRILWLIPMGVTVCYAGVTFLGKHYRVGALLCAALIAVCGKLVYDSPYITKAENAYHIPQSVVEICDLITPKEDGIRVRAAFPSELTYFVRQYDTDILLPFGRDMVEVQWDYYNPVYEVMEKPEIIDTEALVGALKETECSYLILWQDRPVDRAPGDFGLTELARIRGYVVYQIDV